MSEGPIDSKSPPAAATSPRKESVLRHPGSYVPSMALFQSLTFCFISVLPGLFLKS